MHSPEDEGCAKLNDTWLHELFAIADAIYTEHMVREMQQKKEKKEKEKEDGEHRNETEASI